MVILFSCTSKKDKENVYNENYYIIKEVKNFENSQIISSKLFYNKYDTLRQMRLTFYENGKLRSKEFYLNEKLDGPFNGYNENGILFFEGFFKNGLKDSVFKIYDENGKLKKIENYQ